MALFPLLRPLSFLLDLLRFPSLFLKCAICSHGSSGPLLRLHAGCWLGHGGVVATKAWRAILTSNVVRRLANPGWYLYNPLTVLPTALFPRLPRNFLEVSEFQELRSRVSPIVFFLERSSDYDYFSCSRRCSDAGYSSQDLTPLAHAGQCAFCCSSYRCTYQMSDGGTPPGGGKTAWSPA